MRTALSILATGAFESVPDLTTRALLISIGSTDGSAPALHDVLTTENPGDEHGRTSHLSETEIEDLVEFLSSIPFDTPRRRPVRR